MNTSDTHSNSNEAVCYRHSDRATGVTCQRCDRPVCGQCMSQASVGVHCPECKKSSAQRVYSADNLPGARELVTKSLIAVNGGVFLATIVFMGSTLFDIGAEALDFGGTFGPFIADEGEWWRIISGGFLHAGIIHFGFNMYLLWELGRQIERALGPTSYIAVYTASLIGGSFGALLSAPLTPVVGASGAVFGLIGFTVMLYRSRGIGLFDTGLGLLIVINALYSFSGGVSLGGHVGGFVVGLFLGALFYGVEPGGRAPLGGDSVKQLVASVAVAALAFAGALWAASRWMEALS